MALGIVLACCACASALEPSLDISQYAHTSWKVRDGFTKGAISSIAQTPDGYLWLGTEFGLLRFDGVRAVPLATASRPATPKQLTFEACWSRATARCGLAQTRDWLEIIGRAAATGVPVQYASGRASQ